MSRRLPQFSIAALLLTIAAVAVVLALMLQVDYRIGTPILLWSTTVYLAFVAIALVYGRDSIRPFCIGATIPIAYSLAESSCMGILFNPPLEGIPGSNTYNPTHHLGTAILLSIALGYLCVGFRWLIERSSK
jgi:NhaP-type Na+/H+ and K+/H+ antiporter